MAGGPDPPAQAPGSRRRARGGVLNPARGASTDARLPRPANPAGVTRRSGAEARDPRLGGRGAWAFWRGRDRGWEPGDPSEPRRGAGGRVCGMRVALRRVPEDVPAVGRGPCETALLPSPSGNC